MQRGPIAGPMVRRVWSKTQDDEVVGLQNCIKNETKELLKRFQDTPFGGILLECKQFNCSINSLGQLFFLSKILERNNIADIRMIVELGGGYGCLARVTKMVLPETTYIILDLPECLAIQSLYLKATLSNVHIVVHTKIPEKFEKGVIHLVPIFCIHDLNLKTDIFISTAALSETPATLQKIVVEKRFFNAQSAYLTGQLNRWGSQYNFEHQAVIFNGMRASYNLCFANPLHHFDNILNCYEIYGTNFKNE